MQKNGMEKIMETTEIAGLERGQNRDQNFESWGLSFQEASGSDLLEYG